MARVMLENVGKTYPDGTEAVRSLNLEVDDGEFVVLVGPSGCGKSTALRMVAGLEEITSGTIWIGDIAVNHLTPKERDIAMVFQNYALYPHMNVFNNMAFSLKLAKYSKSDIHSRVTSSARTIGLTEYLERKPRALSGGQRQRVAMGRAIVREPRAFLMDEPLSNLDAKLRVQMRAEILQLQNRLAITTLYVTHDQIEAMTMGDRVVVLKRGELQQVAKPQYLYENPRNLFVAGFIGSPAMNLSRGRIVRGGGGFLVIFGEHTLDISYEALDRYDQVPDYVGREVVVGLRPEHFIGDPTGLTDECRMDITPNLIEELGSDSLVHFATSAPPIVSEDMREALDDEDTFRELQRSAERGGQSFTARIAPERRLESGTAVQIGFRTEKLHFFDMASGLALRSDL